MTIEFMIDVAILLSIALITCMLFMLYFLYLLNEREYNYKIKEFRYGIFYKISRLFKKKRKKKKRKIRKLFFTCSICGAERHETGCLGCGAGPIKNKQ